MDQWDHTAWLCLYMPRFLKSSRRFKLTDFHPIRGQANKVNIFKVCQWMEEVGKNLPKELSEEEIEQKWKEYNARSK